MTTTKKISPIVKIGAYLLSLTTFIVGFWHAHLGLKNQHFFGSEYGSLVIAAIILILILISYYFAINGRKVALIFYLICAFTLIIFNLNYFYPYDFKEDLVKEEAGILKDTLIAYSTRSQEIAGVNPTVLTDYLKLLNLREHIISEVQDQQGYKKNARIETEQFNQILVKYKIPIVNPTLQGVENFSEQARILDKKYFSPSIRSFEITTTKVEGKKLEIAKIIFKTNDSLLALKQRYIPVLEFIQSDTSKIDISNDKKNIENNPKNIGQIAKIVSEINSLTKPLNEIQKGKEPFTKLEATITKIGSVGHTLPSISYHIKGGTKEQKVGAWKNILLCFLLDLIVPLAIYVLVRHKEDETPKVVSSNRKFI